MLVLFGLVPPALAQDTIPPRQIRWYEPVLAGVGVSAFFLVDAPLRRSVQASRSAGQDDAARLFRAVGQPEVWALVPGVLVVAGLALKQPELERTGARALGSAALAGGVTLVLKEVFGRSRPDVGGAEPLDFHPFSGNQSMPSGHTAAAFGFAASLADDVHPLWAKIGLYSLATGTAWSRVYNNKHWASDVVAGAIVGIYSAKLVRGRWQVWGIRPPAVFTDGHRLVVSWHGTF